VPLFNTECDCTYKEQGDQESCQRERETVTKKKLGVSKSVTVTIKNRVIRSPVTVTIKNKVIRSAAREGICDHKKNRVKKMLTKGVTLATYCILENYKFTSFFLYVNKLRYCLLLGLIC
jgi:hypothetical protein